MSPISNDDLQAVAAAAERGAASASKPPRETTEHPVVVSEKSHALSLPLVLLLLGAAASAAVGLYQARTASDAAAHALEEFRALQLQWAKTSADYEYLKERVKECCAKGGK